MWWPCASPPVSWEGSSSRTSTGRSSPARRWTTSGSAPPRWRLSPSSGGCSCPRPCRTTPAKPTPRSPAPAARCSRPSSLCSPRPPTSRFPPEWWCSSRSFPAARGAGASLPWCAWASAACPTSSSAPFPEWARPPLRCGRWAPLRWRRSPRSSRCSAATPGSSRGGRWSRRARRPAPPAKPSATASPATCTTRCRTDSASSPSMPAHWPRATICPAIGSRRPANSSAVRRRRRWRICAACCGPLTRGTPPRNSRSSSHPRRQPEPP